MTFLSVAFTPLSTQEEWNDETPVYDILFELGEEPPAHYLKSYSTEQVQLGKELVLFGKPQSKGFQSAGYISKFFVCTSCHNTVREDPDLFKTDPEARLDYAIEKNISFLQASTFWGMVNRETWYNDDYVLKYGDLVVKANKSLKESIQLCATECSQGRYLKDWEMDAILAYYWSLQLKMGDLQMNESDWKLLKESNSSNEFKRNFLKTKYALRSPATFAYPPSDRRKGYGLNGNEKRGKEIYERSCQHCHRVNGESDLVLDESKKTKKWLKKNIDKNSIESIYEIIRLGTHAETGHREYMPHFTKEKMSDQQVEDLRAFIESN